MKVRDLLTDETKWSKGKSVVYRDDVACAWCLSAAVDRCYGASYLLVMNRVANHVGGPIGWNDAPSRTFAEVRALVEELDI